MPSDELESRIKILGKNTKILKQLYFVKYRYGGESVKESTQRICISRNEGYIWQLRWNERGYSGLIPRYAGGRPMNFSYEDLDQLNEMLSQKTTLTIDDVRTLIHQEFGIEYTLKQIRIILKQFNITYGKPFSMNFLRPDNADALLKDLPDISPGMVIGLVDETTPQITANTMRLWSFGHPTLIKNTTKLRIETHNIR